MCHAHSDPCPLCHASGFLFRGGDFLRCERCRGIFRPFDQRPDPEVEKKRYECHQNNPDDAGYRRFLSPLIEAVRISQTSSDRGLDYGSGPEPILCGLLESEGYDIVPYDPFFCARVERLEWRYHYLVCCEVMEHFHRPDQEFRRLHSMLEPGGRLFAMTELYHEGIDFDRWSYKNDFTHLFFYSKETLNWIRNHVGFTDLSIEGRLIIFVK